MSDTQNTARNIRWTIFACVVFMAAAVALVVNKLVTPRVMSNDELRINGALIFEQPRRFEAFELLDQNGETFTQDDFKGHWSLLFFGFTHCPDICPTTMAEMSRLMGALPEPIAADTEVMLFSLDPARDTPAIMKEYVAYFGDDFIGVTGEFLTMRRFANQVNVAFSKVTQGDDYTVDHSGNIVIINPRGDYHGFFKPPFELAKLKATFSSIYQSFDG
ncbi:SCO family protein [Gilvimarinus agarilyticus]|uniref:SCO family protein n=1 Tax=unclassified Gilvimarinus TaxID=2642066 RepID=UPI001C099414|nr:MULTISPECIES: SCO family protein [unclassified Gilvimarinus]MBU2884271.1 SCO family protein [Gilvimarinus agarilyticus]MDO6569410.1 SCO family protein [Gilvimarinus sp. 2_MG-2023]MDO6747564.1 SCO family protein [Gilvimarinus sp. 1_MG-2023]